MTSHTQASARGTFTNRSFHQDSGESMNPIMATTPPVTFRFHAIRLAPVSSDCGGRINSQVPRAGATGSGPDCWLTSGLTLPGANVSFRACQVDNSPPD